MVAEDKWSQAYAFPIKLKPLALWFEMYITLHLGAISSEARKWKQRRRENMKLMPFSDPFTVKMNEEAKRKQKKNEKKKKVILD